MAYNKMIIQGRLTADPELRKTPKGVAVAVATVAVDRPYKKGAPKETDFVDIVAWRRGGEFLAKYFRRGDEILCEGSMQSRKYEGKDGSTRKVWELITSDIRFVGGKKSASDNNDLPEESVEDYQEVDLSDEDLPF